MKGIKIVTKPDGRRYLYRRVNGRLVPLPDLPENDARFLKAYQDAESAAPAPTRGPAGSIAALCAAYLGSMEYKRLAASTRSVRRRVVDRISAERGAGMVTDIEPRHLRRDVRALTHGAAGNRLKAWRALMAFAVEDGWIEDNPSLPVKAPKGETKPHRQWTTGEMAAFRDFWGIGTPERLAFEVIFWTGARCVDAARLGFQNVGKDGWLTFKQQKTGGLAVVPFGTLPDWCAAIRPDFDLFHAAMPIDRMQWIVTRTGAPRSHKAMSQWFSRQATKAGLPDDATAHGLRKARASQLAEIGAAPHRIGAWTGHDSLQEISHYTRAASRKSILAGTEQKQNLGNRIEPVSNCSEKANENKG